MTIAVIGGSGFQRWERFEASACHTVETPYSAEPVPVHAGSLAGQNILFLPRHGRDHSLPPHLINYRANLWALRELGARSIVAIATVGGITRVAEPGLLMIPDQILDYTWGREPTFFDAADGVVAHVDMTEPYCDGLRRCLAEAGNSAGASLVDGGTYAATQGPRFETAAEVRRLERDGADIVGMTGMPEATLARELQLAYATIAIIVNPAAGKVEGGISMDQVRAWQSAGRGAAENLLAAAMPVIREQTFEVPPPLLP
jgi:5'-methylthioadenosine phosphorylase/5'-methylthioinosine phosphorylase